MIKFRERGDFRHFYRFADNFKNLITLGDLDQYGREGVEALKKATPIDTGETASSWSYSIERTKQSMKLIFSNSNVQNGCLVAIVIQYGHATMSGAYVEGIDYINPALEPIFNEIDAKINKEVK